MEKFDRNKFESDLSKYETFDPDYQSFTEMGRSVEWLKQFIEGDSITLKTHVPKNRLDKIRRQGLRVPDENTKRTDSGSAEERAIFATTFSGWKNQEAVYFKVPIDKVFIRSTYSGRSGRRFMMNLRSFLASLERAPFDSRKIEFLIYEDIPPENFVVKKDEK